MTEEEPPPSSAPEVSQQAVTQALMEELNQTNTEKLFLKAQVIDLRAKLAEAVETLQGLSLSKDTPK